jgi:hypothetical protein
MVDEVAIGERFRALAGELNEREWAGCGVLPKLEAGRALWSR